MICRSAAEQYAFEPTESAALSHTQLHGCFLPRRSRRSHYLRRQKTSGLLKRELLLQKFQSMQRNCLDNAEAENFFGLLKRELLYLQKFQSMQRF